MRKTCKRLGALFLAVVMTLSLLPATAFALEGDTPEYTDANINAGLFDVGATVAKDGDNWTATYSNPAHESETNGDGDNAYPKGTVINATAPSYASTTQGAYKSDGHPYFAVDGNVGTPSDAGPSNQVWHTNYSNAAGFGPTSVAGDSEDNYIQLEVVAGAMWLQGVRYMQKADNRLTGGYEVKSSTDGTNWVTVKTGTWNPNNSSFVYAAFDAPVNARFIRLYGTGSGNFMNAKEIRLVKAESQDLTVHSATITVKSIATDNPPLNGATVVIARQTLTTDTNGQVTVENLVDGVEYTGTVTLADYESKTFTVTGSDGATVEVILTALNRTITGTVTDGTNPLAGAKVELVQNNDAKSFVTSVESVTTADSTGAYTLNINSVAAGSYCVRVSKDGHGAALSSAVTVAATEATEAVTANAVQLPVIDTTSAKFAYDMTEETGKRPTLEFAANPTGAVPIARYDNDVMSLSFTSTTRFDNLVKLVGTNVKNGTVEFDATRQNVKRFGLAFRLADQNNWIYIGQFDNAAGSDWNINYWNNGSEEYSSYSNNGPSFKGGDTRHFKFTIADDKLSLWIDGVRVFNEQTITMNSTEIPMTAADVGFICGNNSNGVPDTITIDNLYIFRQDPTFAVTLDNDNSTDVTLSAKIQSSGGNQELGGNDNDQASAGDVIVITGTPGTGQNGKALGQVTVTETTPDSGAQARTVPATLQEDGTFTFTMPEYAVTVTGALKNAFTAELPKAGDPAAEVAPKAGKAYTVTLTSADSESTPVTASYQWYRVTAGASDVAVGTNSATYTPVAEDVNKTLKVVITGTEEFAGIKTLTTAAVQAADVPLTGVTLQRSTITMWTNHTPTTEGEYPSEVGSSTTLTASINPTSATNPTYKWEIVGDDGNSTTSDVITIAAVDDHPEQQTVTATKAGTAKVKVTVDADTVAQDATTSFIVSITVKTKVQNITVKNKDTDVTDQAPVVVYNNADDTDHSVTLNSEVTPADASNKNLIWTRPDGAQGLIRLEREGGDDDPATATGQSVTITAIGANPTDVGEVTVSVAAQDGMGATASFKVDVRRKLAEDHNVSIAGTAKFGETLTVNTDQLVMTQDGKDALTYTWYALDNATSDITDGLTAIHTGKSSAGKTYTLKQTDINKYIAVVVTTDVATHYEGTKTAKMTAAVEKADGPAAPAMTPTDVATSGGKGSINITGYADLESKPTYQIKGGTYGDWTDVNTTGNAPVITEQGTIEGLDAGTYQVRVKESDTHKEGTAGNVTIADADETLYTVTVNATTNGTVTCEPSRAAKDTNVTITVTPATGYELDTLTVTGPDNSTITPQENKFTMPEGNVTITATFKLTKVTITHALTNVNCDRIEHDTPTTHVVNYGEVQTIQLSVEADKGYMLPTSIKVTKTGTTDELGQDAVTYNNQTGLITFTNGVTEDITITAEGVLREYSVQFTLTGGALTGTGPASGKVAHGSGLEARLTANTGYHVPATIQVTMGGTTLIASEGYTYTPAADGKSATVSITKVTGNVVITAVGEKDTTPLTSVTITINHTDTAVDNTDVPHAGDSLFAEAKAGTTDATANYKWYSKTSDSGWTVIAGATSQTYTIPANTAIGTLFKVEAEGNGNYSGTQSAETSAVADPVKLPTAISLDKNTHSMSVGDTLELTATITPDDATDKTVTWEVLEVGTDTASTGVATVTPGTTDGKATVTAVGAGTVRIRAKTSNGRTANCTLTVERANEYAVTWTNDPYSTVTVTANGAAVQNGGNVLGGAEVSISVAPDASISTPEVTVDVTDASGKAVTVTKGTSNVWTFTMPGSAVSINIKVTAGSAVTVTRVELNKTSTSIAVGAEETLVATVTADPNTDENKAVTWTSSDDTKATVDQTGKVTGVAAGTVTITATSTKDNTKKATCEVTVTAATQEAVKLTGLTVKNGDDPVTLTPAFAADTKSYTASVDNDVESVTVTGTADTGATVTVKKGNDVCNGGVVALAVGQNVVTVTVEQDEKTSTEYTITITREAGTVTVDKTALNTAIEAANTAKTGVVPKPNGTEAADVAKDVKFVTVAEMTALETAITAAQGVVAKTDATQDEVNAAVTALNTAVATFKSAIKTGTNESVVDKDALTAAITTAEAAKEGVVVAASADEVDEDKKFVTRAEMTALETAITAAQGIADKTDATQDEVNAAVTALNTAVADFEDAIKTGTKPQEVALTGTVTITGTAKYGVELTATVTGTPNGATLAYQWKRGDTDITGAESKTYRLVKEDIGAVITVVVTADGYTGELTAATAKVAKADGPASNAVPVKCTGEGATGKITGVTTAHEYRKVTTPEAAWTAVTGTEITGLEAGEYEIRVKETDTHNAGAIQTVKVLAYNVETWNVTVTVNNGTDNAPAEVEKNGALNVTLTADAGYELPETITVKMGGTELTTGYTYDKTTGAVAIESVTGDVEITAACTEIVVDKAALETAITAAEDAKDGVVTGSNADEVEEGTKFVTEAEMKALDDAIEAAQALVDKTDATQEQVDAAVSALNEAVKTFNAAKKDGTYVKPSIPSGGGSSSGSSSNTTVEKNPDGSTTTTVTDKKTGTVTETTEKPDGSKEIVETKKDGTVTETTEKTDGSKEVVETKPDGTVTETKTDAEGAKTEKVTDSDKNVAITVTDKDGEVLAKVELPAEIPAPETRFEDVPEGHWADEAIHNMAALEVVNGVGDNHFDMNSSMTRGALATVLSRLSNGQEGLEVSFTDVDADKWYADGIAWAAKTGVVTGYSESNFGPEDVITREQLAVMLCRYARLLGMDTTADSTGLDKFNDGSSTHDWAADSIAWCVNNGILNGMGNGSLAPTATATRAQVAVMLQRFMDLMK